MEVLIIVDIVISSIIIFFIMFRIIKKRRIIKKFFKELLELRKNYISYNTKVAFIKKYNDFRNKLKVTNTKRVNEFIDIYDNLFNLVDVYNEQYVKEELEKNKEFFDNLFDYPLDDEQRRAIITDDDNNLIIAGAGSGKTTTIIGKTRYLLEQKGIDPRLVITISFTNAAKDNFIEKLNDERVYCSTFHKLGKDLIDAGNLKSDIAPDDYTFKIIREYLKDFIINYPDKSKHFIKLYSLYIHQYTDENIDFGRVIELTKGYDFETIKSKQIRSKDIQYKVRNDKKTIKLEKVKSEQELIIANYLFIHGVQYEYEPKYKYNVKTKKKRQYHPDFYLPEYDIYIEHFGINKKGRAPQYNEMVEKEYLDGIEWKRKVHEEYGTNLIETYSYDFDNYKIEKVLEKKLKDNGVVFHNLDYKELIKIISQINNEETFSFYNLISKFIHMFKGNNYDLSKFDEFYNDAVKKDNIRNTYLIELIKDIYIYYQNELIRNDYIDFDDMINLATIKVLNHFNNKLSYIIIDEFQDISYSRYRLVKAIQDKTNAKVIAVGDDWQSIYRFSGCDLNLFVNFGKYFPHPNIMYINNTYRNSQNLINISGAFIMKNEKGQIKKSLKSSKKNIENPIEYYFYKIDIMAAANQAIDRLKELGCKKIAILGRNNSDIERFNVSKRPDLKEVDMSNVFHYNVIFTTVHKAKGLEYDGVIICNMDNYISGFPNKMADDPILDYVTLTQDDYLYEEERRLLYVALTRTKTKCLILVPLTNPSIFSEELNSISKDKIIKNFVEDDEQLHNPLCPKCKNGTLVKRINGKDNSVFISCTNFPLCDFKDPNVDILNNPLCPKCGSPMIEKDGKYGRFLSCIHYPYCNQTINIEVDDDVVKKEPDQKKEIKEKEVDKPQPKKYDPSKCPNCGSKLLKLTAKNGWIFYKCYNYSKCNTILWDKPTGEFCPKCNGILVYGKKGIYCNECKAKLDDEKIICPKCGSKMILRQGKDGKFYGCKNFPDCRYTIDYDKYQKDKNKKLD